MVHEPSCALRSSNIMEEYDDLGLVESNAYVLAYVDGS